MIQKTLLVRVALLVACCTGIDLQSQNYIPPVPIPYNPATVNFTGTYTNGTYTNFTNNTPNTYAYNAVLNPVNVSNSAVYDIKADHSVNLKAGTSVSGLSAGHFHGYIDASPFEVVSFHPDGFNNIPMYDKFELGIRLPGDLTQRIDDFFGNTNTVRDADNAFIAQYPCTNGHGNVFNDSYPNTNPYDDEQISVEATFSFPGKPDQVIYGFYYREYGYLGNMNPATYQTTKWEENTSIQYHWRVRFAPKYSGTYTVKWLIKAKDVNGNMVTVFQDNTGQQFYTIPSANPGFLKMGQSGNFLVTQPNEAGPKTTIFPIGISHAAPNVGGYCNPAYPQEDVPEGECQPWGCASGWGQSRSNTSFPSRYIAHRNEIAEFAQQGANMARVMSGVYSFDFELEKAGVYDADIRKPLNVNIPDSIVWPLSKYHGNNRQAFMWEFDRLLEMAGENDMYIQWVVDDCNTNGFKIVNDGWIAGNMWIHHPYFALIQNANPNSVAQFFTEPIAKKFYKKKLRYIISRYGYSTNLGVIELLNEIHRLNTDVPNTTLDAVAKPWLEEMLEYIKGPYPALNHKDHLLTISNELNSYNNMGVPSSNQMGNAVGLDFISEHPYIDDVAGTNNNHTLYSTFYKTMQMSAITGKACQPGEFGLRSQYDGISITNPCDCNNPGNCFLEGGVLGEYMTPSYHSLLWSSSFVGGLTSGFNNWTSGRTTNSGSMLCGGISDGTEYFKPLQSFIKNYNANHDLDAGSYKPHYFSGAMHESFYLVGDYGNAAIGYTRNRSFWWSNFMDPASNFFYDPNLVSFNNSINWDGRPPFIAPVLTGFIGTVTIDGLDPNQAYIAEFYDTYTDPPQLLGSHSFISYSNYLNDGYGTIYPPIFENDCHKQEYAFIIKPIDEGARIAMPSENFKQESVSAITDQSQVDVKVFPNPASSKLVVQYDKARFSGNQIEILDPSGRLILKQNNVDELNVSGIENGSYLVRFTSGDLIRTFKIAIMH
ncbi:MAG: hypothetical protein K0S33_1027 [Bacteroidetes bacterium]|jgi:hypothetical protein|nr:hypothetical protein [Bacteroidota bacterium]